MIARPKEPTSYSEWRLTRRPGARWSEGLRSVSVQRQGVGKSSATKSRHSSGKRPQLLSRRVVNRGPIARRRVSTLEPRSASAAAPCTAAEGLGAYPLAAYDLSYDIEQNLLEPRRDASVQMGTKPVDSGAIGGYEITQGVSDLGLWSSARIESRRF
jgi:hypothetical protein